MARHFHPCKSFFRRLNDNTTHVNKFADATEAVKWKEMKRERERQKADRKSLFSHESFRQYCIKPNVSGYQFLSYSPYLHRNAWWCRFCQRLMFLRRWPWPRWERRLHLGCRQEDALVLYPLCHLRVETNRNKPNDWGETHIGGWVAV